MRMYVSSRLKWPMQTKRLVYNAELTERRIDTPYMPRGHVQAQAIHTACLLICQN